MDSAMPFVSVIVPVLNGERTLQDCLVSLLKMDYPAEWREILVVDNGSTDRTADIINSFPVRYVREERRGLPHARNKGIEESRGEILAFTDADCVVTAGWLREMVGGFEDDSIGGVDGEIVAYPPVTLVEQYAAMRGVHSYRARRASPLSPFVAGANFAFRREVFHWIGLFDPRLPGGEDIDLTWRFFQVTNLKIRHSPRAIVFHRNPGTVWGLFSQHLRYGRGLAILQSKYPARLLWGWRQELQAWGAVASFAGMAARSALRYGLQGGKKKEAFCPYLTFLRKLGIRVGFVWTVVTGGRR